MFGAQHKSSNCTSGRPGAINLTVHDLLTHGVSIVRLQPVPASHIHPPPAGIYTKDLHDPADNGNVAVRLHDDEKGSYWTMSKSLLRFKNSNVVLPLHPAYASSMVSPQDAFTGLLGKTQHLATIGESSAQINHDHVLQPPSAHHQPRSPQHQADSNAKTSLRAYLSQHGPAGITPPYRARADEDDLLRLATDPTLQASTASAQTIPGLPSFKPQYASIGEARRAMFAKTRSLNIKGQDDVRELFLNTGRYVGRIYEAIRSQPKQPNIFHQEMVDDLAAKVCALGGTAEARLQQIASEIFSRTLSLHTQGDHLRPADVNKYSEAKLRKHENTLPATRRLDVICDILRDCKKIVIDIENAPADAAARFVAFPLSSEKLKYTFKNNNTCRDRKKLVHQGLPVPARLLQTFTCPDRLNAMEADDEESDSNETQVEKLGGAVTNDDETNETNEPINMGAYKHLSGGSYHALVNSQGNVDESDYDSEVTSENEYDEEL